MKVLIITYYWPPAGGSGVQRWLKFVKYLQDFGITPVVYIPENANYPTVDESFLNDVPKGIEILKLPIKNPQDVVGFFTKKSTKKGVANQNQGGILSWIRGNFFIPDAKKFWVKPSVKYLEKYLKNNKIDLLISTGPPHSVHLIAQQLKQKMKLKWLADFRDPWTDLYYNQDFNLMASAKRKNKHLETQVLQQADVVLTVSNALKATFEKVSNNVKVIANGFDNAPEFKEIKLTQKFSLVHIGLLPKQSNPAILWEVLIEISEENKNFKEDLEINLTGNVNIDVITSLKENKLFGNTLLNGYVAHQKAIETQRSSQVLLLLIPQTKHSKGIVTGKIFEYLQAKRPILAIGDTDGDLAVILETTSAGSIIDFEDKNTLKSKILSLYQRYKSDNLQVDSKNIEQYHRKNLTEKLATVIKEIIEY